MKNVLMIPVHIGKANWAIHALNTIKIANYKESKIENETDIVLIVSNLEEAKYFYDITHWSLGMPEIKFLDVRSYIQGFATNNTILDHYDSGSGIVNIKKLCGLHWAVQQNYDFALIVDCDTYFLSPIGVVIDQLSKNYSQKRTFGSRVADELHVDICNKCIDLQSEKSK